MGASAILRLQAAGFSTEQVTALAELIDAQAASKSDLEAFEHRLEMKIVDVKSALTAEIAGVKVDILLLKWMMGFILAFQVAIFAKMFLH